MVSGKALLCRSHSLTKSCCVSSLYLEQSNYGDRELGSGLVKKGAPEAANRSGLIPFPAIQLRIFHKLICYGFCQFALFCFGWGHLFKTEQLTSFFQP